MESALGSMSILLAGLRLKKALQLCAPEEYKVLGAPIEKLLMHTRIDEAPRTEHIKLLINAFEGHTISGSVRELATLDAAISAFLSALSNFTDTSMGVRALCATLNSYRAHITSS